MIDRKYVTNQINRLPNLPGYPTNNAQLTDLVDALQNAAYTEAHAKAVIDALVEDRQLERYPTPGALRDLAWKLRPGDAPAPPGAPRSDCLDCGGSGWRMRTVGHLRGAERCPCDRCGEPAPVEHMDTEALIREIDRKVKAPVARPRRAAEPIATTGSGVLAWR